MCVYWDFINRICQCVDCREREYLAVEAKRKKTSEVENEEDKPLTRLTPL